MNRGSTCDSVQGQIEQEEDAWSFWHKRWASYPLLAPLAEDLLSAPASQAYIERVFSVCDGLTGLDCAVFYVPTNTV